MSSLMSALERRDNYTAMKFRDVFREEVQRSSMNGRSGELQAVVLSNAFVF